MKNIILIGMPGAGKSTIGVVLAKTLGLNFLDTDLVIQQIHGAVLQDILNKNGLVAFKKIENTILSTISVKDSVIATGGSAVYSANGMKHLKEDGTVVYLQLDFEEVNKRIKNISTRGIVIEDGFSLLDLYNERLPLYKQFAEITVECSGLDLEAIVKEITLRI
ncbi:MAG: shikimate kinase [Spirochaetes bacterium GWF1_31_7]|nr:MAG: shikimate kinase [Spirochaetes bacterium GWE1_32_154]OHD48022.1 MAG: shikimate kinase [Spirochaetes bacterium GWF1_31_7]OHD49661.1 MAG: shikimate kinase [Spirochaetes bacterium GWE2_31_10]OHD77108.1 MAG: shikimate kinase [Spirochaetes bacterium RIFOXYB1_FULL_32_8]HBD92765.1 shikimate kinase [Spirochaetia bacterium]